MKVKPSIFSVKVTFELWAMAPRGRATAIAITDLYSMVESMFQSGVPKGIKGTEGMNGDADPAVRKSI